jgi:agmatine deiminase
MGPVGLVLTAVVSPVAVPDFAPIAATLTAWPAHPDEWPGQLLAGARECVASMVRALLSEPGAEEIVVLVRDAVAEASARAALGGSARLLPARYGDIWVRDTGPILVEDTGRLEARCFEVNGWGGKFDFPDDHGIASRIAVELELPHRECPWVLEGGAIDCDGLGTVLTTEQCLLNRNRNGNVLRQQVHAWLARDLGARKVIWLGRGLVGDHTDGHVDNLARFIEPGVIAFTEPNAGEPNTEIHRAVENVLRDEHDAGGNPIDLVPVPSPGVVAGPDGHPMAASYLNFVIGQAAVVVPTYGTRDAEALTALQPHFDKPVIGVRSDALLAGGGSFHCITKAIPLGARP